ncbi:MAG: hypothetical protein EOP53_19435 [Sphingobacteriales bacterium]|nr:MAG: hypothetical protein EOP53_19435 [Sphingobacteriales bacterium]
MKYFHVLLVASILLFTSCGQNKNNAGETGTDSTFNNNSNSASSGNIDASTNNLPENGPVNNMMKPESKLAKINKVDIKEFKDQGIIMITAEGVMPSPCTAMGEIRQTINGKDIHIEIYTLLPPGVTCPQIERTMNHNVQIDTKTLKKGNYNVDVNGIKTTYQLK